jgi:hypothetical protein
VAQQRTFIQRFGHHGICVVPANVLSDDPLIDPDTHEELPSLRRQISLVHGIYHNLLCYARVLHVCSNGLYWADIAATPDFANVQRVILTEEDLYSALAWDIRLQGKSPAQILTLMASHAQAVQPLCQYDELAQPSTLTPAPVVPLQALEESIVVSTEDLQDALKDVGKETNKHVVARFIGTFHMQQALLRAMIDTLMEQLYRAKDHLCALALKARCATIAVLQRWHRQHRQRVVNAVFDWCDEHQAMMWHLTIGVPVAVQAAA